MKKYQRLMIMGLLGMFMSTQGYTALSEELTEETEDVLLTLRDPFWPVGYQPVSLEQQQAKAAEMEIATRAQWPELPLRAISHAGRQRFIAFIDKIGLVEAGDVVLMQEDGLVYRWRIESITEDGIVSTRLGVTQVAPPSFGQE